MARLGDRCLHISQGEILLSAPHIEPNCLTQFVPTFQDYLETMSATIHHTTVSGQEQSNKHQTNDIIIANYNIICANYGCSYCPGVRVRHLTELSLMSTYS